MTKLVILFSVIIAAFSLGGCSNSSNPHGKGFGLFSSANDPDGDGDTKGSNHFPMTRRATGNKVFIFDPNYRAWAVYDRKGKRMNTGKASGGSHYCPDIKRSCRTIVGTFRIRSKGTAGCISHSFPIETQGGAPMPYCMFFSSKYAIHGSDSVPSHNASHGCIRVTPTVAKWLNTKFMSVGSTVIVRPYRR